MGQAATQDVALGSWHQTERSITIVYAWDPNEKHGPAGMDPGFIVANEPLTYKLYFENVETSPSPARTVTIIDHLDYQFNTSSVVLTEVAFGDIVVVPAQFNDSMDEEVALSNGLVVDIEGNVDAGHGIVTWTLTTIDPETNEPPLDPFLGFLPPNIANGEGEGYVTFIVNANDNLLPGASIPNDCIIIFDTNDEIVTNEVVSTVRLAFPDISCESGTITPVPPLEGEGVTISVTLTNLGELTAEGVLVSIFDGDPDKGGVTIQEDISLGTLLVGETDDFQVSWIPDRVAGIDSLLIIADPQDSIKEVTEANNRRWLVFEVNERSYTVNLADGMNK